MKRAFVFGNGKTRLNIEFDEVKPYGQIYACNAVYRTYAPDYLIAVDRKMIDEISVNGYQNKNPVYTYFNIYKKHYLGFNLIEPNLGWSSGPSAIFLACSHKVDEVYLFGFDFEGINGLINNVFAGTQNYRGTDQKPVYYQNWLRQTDTVVKDNPNIKFTRVTIPNFYETKFKYDNYYQIYYDDFRKTMSEWQKIR
jgi:hypothetical protein